MKPKPLNPPAPLATIHVVIEIRHTFAQSGTQIGVAPAPAVPALPAAEPAAEHGAPALPPEGERDGRAFASFPLSAQERAITRREMLAAYFRAKEEGAAPKAAYMAARVVHVRRFGKSCTTRSIRRWVCLISRQGGIASAPLAAYLDYKTAPHAKARRGAKSIPASKQGKA